MTLPTLASRPICSTNRRYILEEAASGVETYIHPPRTFQNKIIDEFKIGF